jgi:LmbE family N-acetylglucosaminyl deacetylase
MSELIKRLSSDGKFMLIRNWWHWLKLKLRSKSVAGAYLIFALVVLLATTLFWSINSANIQLGNADQLIYTDLMKSISTFQAAALSGQHAFLIKWPLFLLVHIFGTSRASYTTLTVLTVLATVLLFVLILRRIERRPLVLGTLCLALASVLLVIPAQPYAGGILPVNMAMLATRNIEYIIFIGSLGLIVFFPRLKCWQFWCGIIALSFLDASDKLFLGLSLGSALLVLVTYSLTHHWKLVSDSGRWLVGCLGAALGATGILWVINVSHLTHILNQSSANPYQLVQNLKDVVLGVIYAISGLLTNLGANPAFDAITIRSFPHLLLERLFSLGGLAFVINLVIAVIGVAAISLLLWSSFKTKKRSKFISWDNWTFLTLWLIWTVVVAIILFIFTNHDYEVDARYLTICLFAVFMAIAVVGRRYKWPTKRWLSIGGILLIGIISGFISASRTFQDQNHAMAEDNNRDSLIIEALQHHSVSALVGDYWRVVPTELQSHNQLKILPLSSCTQPLSILSSSSWNINLNTHSFAYLLSFDRSLTNFPSCSLQQVVGQYGRPNASILIAGTLANPKEELLLYDRGAHHSSPISTTAPASTILPIPISQLPNTSCQAPTVLNLVAHEDDDLLFMNPTILQDIQAGYCVRTVYLTAGDGGQGQYYWLDREQGDEAAYNLMDGQVSNIWVSRIVSLPDQEYITVANPRGNTNVSLIYMHLPDGNLKGQGFSSTHFESLVKLESGQDKILQTVDGQSNYTDSQLVDALVNLMFAYQPTIINTQANYVNAQYPDHSDHMAVGRYVKRAYKLYETEQYANQVTIPIKFYIGYPARTMPQNVFGTLLTEKEAAFLAYAKFDNGACQSLILCTTTKSHTYGNYLIREYQNPY